MKQLSGTKTERNLHLALDGEAQICLKYLWYEEKAREEGLHEIAQIFETVAGNEHKHAEVWFRFLGGALTTGENLESAAGGEHYEWSELYETYAREAEEEGFTDIARAFRDVGQIEKAHEQTFRSLSSRLSGDFFGGRGGNGVALSCLRARPCRKRTALCLPRMRERQRAFQETLS